MFLYPRYNSSRAAAVGFAPQHDLALMRAEGANDVPYFRLPEEVYAPEPGEKFLMLSRPGSISELVAVSRWQANVPVQGKEQRVPNDPSFGSTNVLQRSFKAYIFRGKGGAGQSGSPVVNKNGDVFGMMIAGNDETLVVIPLSRAMLKSLSNDC